MSTLKVNTIETTSGVERATAVLWGVVSGLGTFTLNNDMNISSATDNATGQYVFNFSVTLPNVNYCPTTSDGYETLNTWNRSIGFSRIPLRSTTSAGINTSTHASGLGQGNQEDKYNLSMAVFTN